MTEHVKIGTHDGCFHCDEALACFMLKTLPRYKDAIIVRSRNMNILNTCDIVVDVGGEYNPCKHRYDHHMRDFNESVSTIIKKPGHDWKTKLSSAGLIYCHFGHEIIKELVPQASDDDIEIIFKHIYNTFIQEIDSIDNGISICNESSKYQIVTDLSSRVKFLNPPWNSKDLDPNTQFLKAVKLTGEDFVQHVNYTANVWLPARSIVEEAIAKRFEVDPSGEIIELSQCVPWFQHLFAIEKEQNIKPLLKYVIFKDDTYRIRCVPVKPDSFKCRIVKINYSQSKLGFIESWAGLQNEALVNACGIEGATFVHSVRFIGGNRMREGILMMARKALEQERTT
ncbi:UPF0160 protein MYG1 [Apis cerana cerana]|uniref:UPF0160 protein MYG1 n=1 Tax=Apis cerana cerana TaxID=94128 RepID=A0A2A3E5J6_APICC|nr:UPF0160 protein MYG1 [Apis cerana cerana]